ncbi:hypothetical protein SAMN05444363_0741 [Flavobacterium terrae]|uniref:Uncharacterized protein n=2 Tax=Flavobacterium terrae TaxID=415425 RepID=A0A1M6BG16_9FLAO|nr:hypothetical protein SAMN05444363_0741 [Flavobacterium terrae]
MFLVLFLQKKRKALQMKKIALILSFIVAIVTSCTVEPNDVTAERIQNQNLIEPTFMSGDLNNVPYVNLRPQTYTGVTSMQTEVETYQMTPTVQYNYLLLQGSDITLTDAPQSTSILIDIRIPECKWAVGTYNLSDDLTTGINGLDCVARLIEIGGETKTRLVSGSLTITEFNLATSTIKGTFNFTYQRRNGSVYEGSYELTNGAFKYKLDAPFFN